MIFTFT